MRNNRAFAIIGAAAVFAAALVPTARGATLGHTTLIPHKGESGEAPENTMPSFRLAVDRGFGFECDIALSKDGRVFTFHDRDFARATDGAVSNKCGELTWDEISRIDIGGHGRWKGSKYAGTRPALLEEVLELARDGRMIYIDTGGPEIVPYVRDVFAGQSRATPANILFLSSNKETCRALKRELPGFKVLWTSSSRHWETHGFPCVTADEMIAAIREVGADGVDCHFDPETVSAEAVAAVHAAGFEFHVWTVDNVKDAETAFRNGVDTLTTNYAQKLLQTAEGIRAAPPSFTFGTWNIAHYSCGTTYPSNISADDMPAYIAKYAAFLDKADVSVMGVCEDSWFCDAAATMTARETIFPRYSGAAVEEMRPFDYNSLYWTNAVCLATGRRMFTKAADTRFYRWARLRIAEREVVVVEAHLDWNITPPGHEDDRKSQIRELIEDFKDEPCVVIGGDFNTSLMLEDGKTEINTPKDYEPFREAGYVGAHWGTIKTWPATNPFLTIDNIFAKGLRISDVQTLVDPSLSDHALMRCRLTFDDSAPPRAPKALVIMLDGQRGDTIDNGLAPNLRRLADGQWQPGYRGAWTLWAGTIRDGTTESAPNHVAIATGMTVAKSGIDWNPDLVAHPTVEAKLPTWQTRLVRKRAGTKALFVTAWKTDLHISPSYDVKIILDREGECPKDLVKILSESDGPDAVMWYCGIPDEAGHAHGYYPYSPEYAAAVRQADDWVGDVLAAIAARPTFGQEDWLIAVTADHGGWERSHGQRSTACYTIPLIFAGRHVMQGRMPGVPRNYDIAPTVLTHFGIDISGIDFDGRVRGNDAPAVFPERPLTDGLAVYLSFDGDMANKGTADVTAELRGAAATIADGASGCALRVSPSADAAGSVLLKGSEQLQFENGNEFTFAAWVRVPGPQTGNPVVFANKDWRDGTNPGVAFAASQGVDMSRVYPGHYDRKTRGDHRDFMFNCGRDGGKREDLGVYKTVPGEWAFYAATRGPDGVARFYQGSPDGTLYCVADDLSDIAFGTGLPFYIGQDGTGASPDAFVGDIDDFAIWTRTLSNEDIRRVFEGGLR